MKVKKKENESLCVFYHRFTQGFCSPIKWNEGKKRKKKNSKIVWGTTYLTHTQKEKIQDRFLSQERELQLPL